MIEARFGQAIERIGMGIDLTMPTGRSLAIARRIGSGIVWSPPIEIGTAPASWIRRKNNSIISIERLKSSGLTGASPTSATLQRS